MKPQARQMMAPHGVASAEGDDTPRYFFLTEKVRLVDMRGAANMCGFRTPESVIDMMGQGFPQPVAPTGGDFRWRVREIDAWLDSLPAADLQRRRRRARPTTPSRSIEAAQ